MIVSKRKRGFTVVEIILASVIIAGMAYVLSQLYIQGIRFWNLSTTQSDLRSTGRYALDYMTRELELATRGEASSPPNLSIPAAPNNDVITYYHPQMDVSGNVISDATGHIVWDTNTTRQIQFLSSPGRLVRTVGGIPNQFAEQVAGISFEDASIDSSLAADELRITMVLSKNAPLQGIVSVSMVSKISLRSQ